MEKYIKQIEEIFNHVCIILKVRYLRLKIMNRQGPVKNTDGMVLAYAKLDEKTIVLDILTPKRRQPKSINSILRLLAHEIAHYQKPPYRQRYKGKWILRQHYPQFYKQVNKNVEKFKKDRLFCQYFEL